MVLRFCWGNFSRATEQWERWLGFYYQVSLACFVPLQKHCVCVGNLCAFLSRWGGSCSSCSRDGYWGIRSRSSEQSLPASTQDPASQENRCCLCHRLCLPQQGPNGGKNETFKCIFVCGWERIADWLSPSLKEQWFCDRAVYFPVDYLVLESWHEADILFPLLCRELPLHQQRPLAIEPSGHECPVRATTCQVCVKSPTRARRVIAFFFFFILIDFSVCG